MAVFDRTRSLIVLGTLLFFTSFASTQNLNDDVVSCIPSSAKGWEVNCKEQAFVSSDPSSMSLGVRAWLFQGTLDLNQASKRELQMLPGIGAGTAERIAKSRASQGPFRRVAELERVKGIGPKTRKKIAPFLHVSESPISESSTR
ncbi:MAG: helix-hairpin-helix domain-containing protein [Deltaproteobacteria bacterium]|nr:helix-hairpin-helix domain-containing protein [Deltaproteobacteria bacterium]